MENTYSKAMKWWKGTNDSLTRRISEHVGNEPWRKDLKLSTWMEKDEWQYLWKPCCFVVFFTSR